MHPIRKQRLQIVIFIVIAASIATGLVVYALKDNLNLFFTPSQIKAGEAPIGIVIRAGGMVEAGSIARQVDELETQFVVTDFTHSIVVSYRGILPALFAEKEGVVVKGKLNKDGRFIASEVLAKHDENYMPPELKDVLPKEKMVKN